MAPKAAVNDGDGGVEAGSTSRGAVRRAVGSGIRSLFAGATGAAASSSRASRAGAGLPPSGLATIYSTVYVSTAAVQFSDRDVADLLATSRMNNSALDFTGMLLVKDGQFKQALEGPEPAVRALMAKISADARHTDLWTLSEEQRQIRQFPERTMGYQGLTDESIRAIPGYDRFFDAAADSARAWETTSRAMWLLDWFHSHGCSEHGRSRPSRQAGWGSGSTLKPAGLFAAFIRMSIQSRLMAGSLLPSNWK